MKRYLVLLFVGIWSSLQALPSGGEVIKGEALIASSHSKSLNVQTDGKAIIHWDRFDISAGESVSFNQAQPKMAVLNRVTGKSPSKILGNLHANCPIYLINGKGVLIGKDAQIATAGFIASTADISNDSFWEGHELTFQNLQEGTIVNLGTILCDKEDIVLIARSITNTGEMQALEGYVTLTTTEMVIHPDEKKQVFIRIEKPSSQNERIENHGRIEAKAIHLETCSPYAKAIHHTGVMQTFVTREENGRIFLSAHHGGAEVNGKLEAPAGAIEIAAQEITLYDKAILQTSSNNAGGSITLGRTGTQIVEVIPGAKLLANAHEEGNGGEIAVWSKEKTHFEGKAQTRGGRLSGNGGKIDISTQGELYRVAGKVDTDAPNGKSGHITFDPKFVTIQPDGVDSATGNTFSTNPTETATISGQTLEAALNSGSVTIQANTDIAFNDSINVTGWWNGLTLQAGRSIQFGGELTLNGGDFTAVINDAGAISADRDLGTATFSMYSLGSFALSKITTQGGNASVDVGTFGGPQEGEIYLSGGNIDAGGGNISLKGFGRLDGSDGASGVTISDYTQIKTSGSGTITCQGTGGNGSQGNHGIYLSDNTTLTQAENGRIYFSGLGGGDGSGSMNSGIIHAGMIESTGSGNIDLEGTAIGGVNLNTGVCFVSGGSAKVLSGNLTLTGVGKGTGNQNYGVRFD